VITHSSQAREGVAALNHGLAMLYKQKWGEWMTHFSASQGGRRWGRISLSEIPERPFWESARTFLNEDNVKICKGGARHRSPQSGQQMHAWIQKNYPAHSGTPKTLRELVLTQRQLVDTAFAKRGQDREVQAACRQKAEQLEESTIALQAKVDADALMTRKDRAALLRQNGRFAESEQFCGLESKPPARYRTRRSWASTSRLRRSADGSR